LFLNRWARKGLQDGDLSALRELRDPARWDDPNPARIERLRRRGFVAGRSGEKARITTKGGLALLFRKGERRRKSPGTATAVVGEPRDERALLTELLNEIDGVEKLPMQPRRDDSAPRPKTGAR
jgi:hypothetical protein